MRVAWAEFGLLDEAGFGSYEKRALVTLAVHGVSDAATLCRDGDIPTSKIYAAMGDDEQAYAYLEKALAGMAGLDDTLHHIEFRQDIRLDPAFAHLRQTRRFHAILTRYYGNDSPLQEGG